MSKVLSHPDKEEIIRMLTNAVSLEKISKWLKERYPGNKDLHITTITLQAFRKKHLQLNKALISKIKKTIANNNNMGAVEKKHAAISTVVESSNAYKDKLSEVEAVFMDVPKRILELDKLVSSRMEYYFNKVNSSDKITTNIKADRILSDYMRQQSELYRDWKKLVEGLGIDNTDNNSVKLDVVYEQIGIIREVVREMLSEIDPSLAMVFLDKLSERINAIEYKNMATDILRHSNKISNKIMEVETNILNATDKL